MSFLNVGQGDAQIIETQNKMLWIDVSNDTLTIQKWLQENQKDTIDIIIITHPDLDHYGTLGILMESIPIKHIILPHGNKTTFTWLQTLSLIEYKQIPTSKVYRGHTLSLESDSKLHFIWPTPQTTLEGNNLSYVTRLVHGNNHVLLTGDIEQEAEFEILRFKDSLHSQILKVAHHGSSSSSSLPFLGRIHFEWAIISSDSTIFGHPHYSTLQKLLFFILPSQILRTDKQSSIEFLISPEKINFL